MNGFAAYPSPKDRVVFITDGGSIINMGSIVWKLGYGGMAGYNTAKAAISGMSRGSSRQDQPKDFFLFTLSFTTSSIRSVTSSHEGQTGNFAKKLTPNGGM
ncbi:MAG: hypothetical protein H8E94_02380 [Alphaproteobacteria bacterium]|nr:hypothetical protein [Alphaproteobacteria bacterium]MBL6945562.1 hypothetical protein [Rhodospirillales bacterium]